MSNTTTLAAPTRRLFAGLIVATIATASAGGWALTAAATGPTDEPSTAATVEDVTADRPAAIASGLMPTAARPIIVADAYHGVGFTVCRSGTEPIVVADAYHGVGFTVCRNRAQPIVVADPYPWPWITICRNGTDPIVVADAYHGVGVTVCR